jgi:hypothetical protein
MAVPIDGSMDVLPAANSLRVRKARLCFKSVNIAATRSRVDQTDRVLAQAGARGDKERRHISATALNSKAF